MTTDTGHGATWAQQWIADQIGRAERIATIQAQIAATQSVHCRIALRERLARIMIKHTHTALCIAAATTVGADGHTWHTSERSVLVATETAENGCVMRIDINNQPTDIASRAVSVIGVNGIGVQVTYTLNAGAGGVELYEFAPPAGYYADTPSIDVMDNYQAHVLICEIDTLLAF